MTLLRPAVATVAFGALLAAQGLDDPNRTLARAWSDDPAFWRVPIHTQRADAKLGAYGRWAAGRDYKVSFHDGFVFHPAVGRNRDAAPLRWTTLRVASGGVPIADVGESQHWHDERRYEYRFDGVTEAYDVRDDGVEQTFVVARRPGTDGDLVIEGRFDTRLTPVERYVAPRHGALEFADADGTSVVRYGAAFAFDASGRRTPITTSFEDGVVRLSVDGAWMAAATFPVTVDPLTSTTVQYITSFVLTTPALHREDESPDPETAIAFTRQLAVGDTDLYVYVRDSVSMRLVYSDVTTNWHSLMPDVTYVPGADRWVIGFWRHSPTENRMRAYFHDRGNRVANSGVLADNHNPGSEHASFPSVGGTSHPSPSEGTTALMVYRADPFFGNSATSVIWGVGLDATLRRFTNQRVRVSATNQDAEAPDVNCQLGWGDTGWIVAYQARTDAVDDYDVYVTKISGTLGWMGSAQVGPDGLGDKVRPVVQGWDGRYVVAMLQDVTPELNGQHFGRNVLVQRFDWGDWASTPTTQPHRVAVSRSNQELTRLGLAYDGSSRSHWCLVAEAAGPSVLVRRLGYTGGVVESADVNGGAAGSYHPAVTWDSRRHEFPILYITRNSGTLEGRSMQYSPNAWNLLYGTGCGPGTIGSVVNPNAGSEFFEVQLTAAPPGQPGVLMLGTAAGSLDLSVLGAPNCFLNLASVAVAIPCSTDTVGRVTFTTPLPDVPLVTGDLYWQFAYAWPARPHALAIGVTRGMRSHVQ